MPSSIPRLRKVETTKSNTLAATVLKIVLTLTPHQANRFSTGLACASPCVTDPN